jgi:TPR repeat protein
MAKPMEDAYRRFDPKVESILLRADEKWNAGELRSAFRLFLAAAKLGDMIGQLNLGYFYDVGIGVKRNRNAARRWYLRSYRKGHASGASNIGTIYRDEEDTKRALIWFERAVERGDIDANLEIAKIYLRDKEQADKALPHLRCVVKAKAGTEVCVAFFEEAQRLLKKHGAKRK